MFRYMNYGPYICIGAVLAVLFVLWIFWGGKNYEFVGLGPLAPETRGSYTGSVYDWGQITPNMDIDPTSSTVLIDNTPSIPVQRIETVCVNEDPPIIDLSEAQIRGTSSLNQNESQIRETSSFNPAESQIRETSSFNPAEIRGICLSDSLPPAPNIPTDTSSFPPSVLQPPPVPTFPLTTSQISQPTIYKGRNGRPISKGERICCQTMERIYGVPFVSVWPDWLVNPETGQKLELDCYNEELRIAIEYNGEQHYKWPNFTQQSYQQFINQVRRDDLKKELCDRYGVYLIVVPYSVPHDRIAQYIMSYLPETLQKRLEEERTLDDLQ